MIAEFPAQKAGPITMPIELWTRVGPGNHVQIPALEAATLTEEGASHCKV